MTTLAQRVAALEEAALEVEARLRLLEAAAEEAEGNFEALPFEEDVCEECFQLHRAGACEGGRS